MIHSCGIYVEDEAERCHHAFDDSMGQGDPRGGFNEMVFGVKCCCIQERLRWGE